MLTDWIVSVTTEPAVTRKRVTSKRGLIRRRRVELNLAKVEAIAVDPSIFGRILGYGTVTVVGTGGTREPVEFIAAPLDFRRVVQLRSHGEFAPHLAPRRTRLAIASSGNTQAVLGEWVR